jgi:hypothetical protein
MRPVGLFSNKRSPRQGRRASGLAPKLFLAAVLASAFAACLASSAAAAGEGPGWELFAGTFPTNLVAPVNERQEVSIDAEGGSFELIYRGEETAAIPYGASAEAVQSALEALPRIGGVGGHVTVTGGPAAYVITFTGALAGREVRELEVTSGGLTGGAALATVSVRTLGGASGVLEIDVVNVGAKASSGTITVTDTLPAGVVAKEAGERAKLGEAGANFGVGAQVGHELWDCTGNGPSAAPHVEGATVVTCINDPSGLPSIEGGAGLPAAPGVPGPNRQPPIAITLEAGAEVSGQNHVVIAGGGALSSTAIHQPITASAKPAPFGFASWQAWFSNADGTIDARAGSHPYSATFAFNLATANAAGRERLGYLSGGEVRDLEARLPPGFVGNPAVVGQCTRAQLLEFTCPSNSQVGISEVNTISGLALGFQVFNMAPPPGVAAEFAFNFENIPVYLDSTVRTDGDYGITTSVHNVPQRVATQSFVTLWGTPTDASHNAWRNGIEGGCGPVEIERLIPGKEYCLAPQRTSNRPVLTLPTSCKGPQTFILRALSAWQDPNANAEAVAESNDADGSGLGFGACEGLGFAPALTIAPELADSDSATGLTAEVKPSLGGLEEAGGLATSAIKHATVALPEGFVVNPGQAAGLQACGENEAESAIATVGPAHCPAASKIGTAKIKSPLIEADPEKELQGEVFLLRSNPPTIHLLVAASADGVNLKLVGVARLNTSTGQITTTFGEDPVTEAEDPALREHMALPALPASDFKLTFDGGVKAALDTPVHCGTYEVQNADFMPWASPFIPDFFAKATTAVAAGPNGGPCPSGPLPFSPSLTAGSTNTEAGAFTGFTQLLSRGDGQQRIEKFQFTEPAGMAGMLSQVPLCAEAQASAGACAAASKIGHAIVQAGPGANPLTLPQPGGPEIPIYLTAPYKGAPFGLSIATPIVAGPFNLGTIITRAKIEVDPHTAQITITTDPLPQIIDGVPTDIRSIYAVIDRPSFLFNPTNCSPQQFVGTATSAGGAASAPLSSRFGVGACKALKFTPKFSVSTAGKTSKAAGASLVTKLAYPKEPQGSQANIAYVKVELPKQLPSRLTTLQKACTAAQFDANPAGCPAASIIGHAVVHTPVLPVPLQGPAYFVSHGNEAFPSLTMVLQGYGVTIDLVGTTLIRKGVTSTTFKSTPDVPFETFELTLPQGPFSALAANGDLCQSKLQMPIEYHAQNGVLLKQSTPIKVTGCSASIAILSHKIKGRNLILKVSVPSAGKLTASGKGLSKATKKAKGRETITLKLHTRKGGKLKTRVRLSFMPSKGKSLAKSVGVGFR